tara:strand:- start:650 stop:1168 length:519 start_codon:yes stop_codon:yes gene_type:complete
MKKENKVEFANEPTNLKLEYDDISPFTGNKCVLIESDPRTGMESRICMESGYTTTDRFAVGSRALDSYEKQIPELYRDTKFIDQLLNQVWYLATMRTQDACLYAMGKTKDDYKWKLAQVRALADDEKENYPIQDQEGKYHSHIVDVDNAEEFDKNNFKGAIDKFYSIIGREV